MKIIQESYTPENGWKELRSDTSHDKINLVFNFGSRELVSDKLCFEKVKEKFPNAVIVSVSTAGEIAGDKLYEHSLSLTGISFKHTPFDFICVDQTSAEESEASGIEIGRRLAKSHDLKHILVFTEGLNINGTALVNGISSVVDRIPITGGLAGDGNDFNETFVGLNEPAKPNKAIGIGLRGDNILTGYGSFGGWDSFGADRLVTKSKGNVLYEIDGKSALDLYKTYLGDKAKELPSSGLLFPLRVKVEGEPNPLVRTILSVDENEKSMTFAGDVPEGSYVRLMKANFERLIEGAEDAAKNSKLALEHDEIDLAILISCVGRKLVLKQRTDDEIMAVRDIVGANPATCGFYSYGEISTDKEVGKCELHNQTMTITYLKEIN